MNVVMPSNDPPTGATGHAADSPGYDAFFRAEYPRLVALGVALTGDREASRDVAAEALLRAFRDWGRVSALDRPGAWTRRVALNLVADGARRRRSERDIVQRVGRDPLLRVVSDPDERSSDEFWAAVRSLPERQAIAVAHYYVVDHSVEEIAAAMGVTTGTVKTTLSQARHSLARRLSIEETS